MATPAANEPAVTTPGVADPGPLGLAGFALTTVLLSGVNAGRISTGALTFVGMALFYGGLGQFMAGMWEFRNRNTFGATAFSSFGAFWMGLGIMEVFDTLGHPATPYFTGDGAIWFLFLWAVFTTYMCVAASRTNGAVLTVFVLLALTFWALWIGALRGDAPGKGFTSLGGWLGFITAIAAFYTSLAGVANSTWGRIVFPVYPITRT